MSLRSPPDGADDGAPPPQRTPAASPTIFPPRRVRRILVFLRDRSCLKFWVISPEKWNSADLPGRESGQGRCWSPLGGGAPSGAGRCATGESVTPIAAPLPYASLISDDDEDLSFLEEPSKATTCRTIQIRTNSTPTATSSRPSKAMTRRTIQIRTNSTPTATPSRPSKATTLPVVRFAAQACSGVAGPRRSPWLEGVQPIPWAMRMSIAVDVARGLSFLHSLDANVIYRDLKASNVLLDSDFSAKLSDFGLARDGPTGDNTHVSTRVVGTRGYAAPEYVATGHLTPKSDVYSFGVVLLELLSGRRAMDDERVGSVEETLVDWAKPFLSDSKRVLRIMDTRLGGQYPKKAAQAAAALALQCLHTDPKNRPLMIDILATLERLHSKETLRTQQPKIDHHGVKHSNHLAR
ncbi:hypothetical protein ACLB2K_031637 [Fragaria x ananassa]